MIGLGLSFIAKGKAKMYFECPTGSNLIIDILKSHEVLSFGIIRDSCILPVYILTLEDTIICRIPENVIMNLLKTDEGFINSFILFYTEELSKTRQLLNMFTMNSKERISNALLMIGNKFGINKKTGELNYQLTRREIGNLSNTCEENVSRQISALAKKGIIDRKGRNRIYIKNYKKLSEIAGIN